MKKHFFTLIGMLFVLSACTPADDSQDNSPTDTAETETPEATETTGIMAYYPNKGPTGYGESAKNRVCFSPAQLDTANQGDMFCFTNTDKALKVLAVNQDQTCEGYWWRVGTVRISRLTTDIQNASKTDPCFANENCEFNEAELVSVKEIDNLVQCADANML